MLLYADSKLTKLEELTQELNQNAKEAKTLLSSANIKSAIAQSFTDLESSTTTKITQLQNDLHSTIDSTLSTKSEELKTQNSSMFSTQLREFLTDEKIKSIVGVSELKDKVSSDFLAQNTQNITNALKANLEPTLKELLHQELKQTLEPSIASDVKTALEQKITQTLEETISAIEVSEIPLTNEQIISIVGTMLNEPSAMETIRVEFSKTINEKLNTNSDLAREFATQITSKIGDFFQTQVLDFKSFLLRSHQALASQTQIIAQAHNIIANKHLQDLELKFEQELAQKREEYQQKLKDPNTIKHNIYQTI